MTDMAYWDRPAVARTGGWRPKPCIQCGSLHCHWCGRELRPAYSRGKAKHATRDHLPAKSNLKDGEQAKVVPACMPCNTRRGNDDSWIPFHEREVTR